MSAGPLKIYAFDLADGTPYWLRFGTVPTKINYRGEQHEITAITQVRLSINRTVQTPVRLNFNGRSIYFAEGSNSVDVTSSFGGSNQAQFVVVGTDTTVSLYLDISCKIKA